MSSSKTILRNELWVDGVGQCSTLETSEGLSTRVSNYAGSSLQDESKLLFGDSAHKHGFLDPLGEALDAE